MDAKAETARAYAGYDEDQWKRFLRFTRDEAQNLSALYNSWDEVYANEKSAVLARVNALLEPEEIPKANTRLMNWRMPKAYKKITAQRNRQGESNKSTDQSMGREKPFDPIRDSA